MRLSITNLVNDGGGVDTASTTSTAAAAAAATAGDDLKEDRLTLRSPMAVVEVVEASRETLVPDGRAAKSERGVTAG